MSTVMQDRPRRALLKPVHCRPLRPLQRCRHAGTIARSHVIMSGVVAIVGTGIFAAVDQSYGRPAAAPQAAEINARLAAPAAVAAPAVSVPMPAKMSEILPSSQLAVAPLAPIAVAARTKGDVSETRSEAVPAAQSSAALVAPTAPDRGLVAPERPATTGSLATPRSASPPGSSAGMGRRPQAAERSSAAPGDCPAPALRAVLADVSARFGAVTVVAAHQGRLNNHTAGSPREKLHHDCKAIDFRPDRSRVDEIKAYLRSRPEIAGVESYRDGVVHMDVAAVKGPSPGASKSEVAQTEERTTTPADR